MIALDFALSMLPINFHVCIYVSKGCGALLLLQIHILELAAKRSIRPRPFALSRKNWYLIDTIGETKASVIAYSIAETAKANNLKPYEYFKYLLKDLPKHGEFEDPIYLDDLFP